MICVALVFKDLNLDEDPIAIASFSAMEKGILVSTPAGINGPHYKTLSNGIPWVLTVASVTIDRWFGGTLTLENGLCITGWSLFPGETMLQKLPLVCTIKPFQHVIPLHHYPKHLMASSYVI